ncbi:hypothetical protein OH491_17520 [Termitidicoccus mucosus]|uniref:Uncharacterized protein n=1 Tax=Termitidicoccus mucosus TaxID=1184151 RepID=A0A178IKS6_9BACT|nr:hypothetical protein AW736_11080 [Opitutaceae bacterium TSB47]
MKPKHIIAAVIFTVLLALACAAAPDINRALGSKPGHPITWVAFFAVGALGIWYCYYNTSAKQTARERAAQSIAIPHPKYPFTDDMAKIVGCCAGCECDARRMIQVGLEWLDANPSEADCIKSAQAGGGLVSLPGFMLTAMYNAAPGASFGLLSRSAGTVLRINEIGWPAFVAASMAENAKEDSAG